MITKFHKSFPIVRHSTALILLSLAFPFPATQNPNSEFIQMGIVIIQMIATECVASNRCHICGVSFEFKRQLRWQVNPFTRGQGLATDLTWTSCVYRSISSRLSFERISRHGTFVDLRGLQASGNTYCEMSTLRMLSHRRLPRREANNLGFLELFGFSVGLPDWWITKCRTPKASGWEMFCHCGWQWLCVTENENRFELFPRNPNFADVELKLRIDMLHVDGSETHFKRRRKEPTDAVPRQLCSFEKALQSQSRGSETNRILYFDTWAAPLVWSLTRPKCFSTSLSNFFVVTPYCVTPTQLASLYPPGEDVVNWIRRENR